jgi:HEAT repeat protein
VTRDAAAEAWLLARELEHAGNVDGLIALLADPVARAAAARRLGRLRDARALKPLARLLRVADLDARSAAATALAEIGDPAAVPLLLEAIGDPLEAARRIQPLGLTLPGFLRHPGRALAEVEEGAEARGVFENWVLDALARLQARETLDAFLLLLGSEDRGHRAWAARSLATIGDPAAIGALRAARAREPFHRRGAYSRAIAALQRGSSSARP